MPKQLSEYLPTCERCKWWREESDSSDVERWGECHRNPPTLVMHEDTPLSMWPSTDPGHGCGEFGAKQ